MFSMFYVNILWSKGQNFTPSNIGECQQSYPQIRCHHTHVTTIVAATREPPLWEPQYHQTHVPMLRPQYHNHSSATTVGATPPTLKRFRCMMRKIPNTHYNLFSTQIYFGLQKTTQYLPQCIAMIVK